MEKIIKKKNKSTNLSRVQSRFVECSVQTRVGALPLLLSANSGMAKNRSNGKIDAYDYGKSQSSIGVVWGVIGSTSHKRKQTSTHHHTHDRISLPELGCLDPFAPYTHNAHRTVYV